MKAQQILKRLILGVLVLGMNIISGCQKNASEPTSDTTAATDLEQATGVSDDIVNMADNAAKGTNGFRLSSDNTYEGLGGCATVTRDTINHVITIDFGSSNCMCLDGRYRRGEIIISYSGGGYFDSGSVKTITFNAYYVNDNHVEGTKSITNNGLNQAGHYTWNIVATNMKITRTDGKYHEWNMNRVREMIQGQNTETIWDDAYSITGSANGTCSNGNSCSATITNPLIREIACHWIQQGTIVITPSNKPVMTLDFGSGNCDDIATVTVNNVSHTITLH